MLKEKTVKVEIGGEIKTMRQMQTKKTVKVNKSNKMNLGYWGGKAIIMIIKKKGKEKATEVR